jgi:hypothetical protein
LFTSGESRCKRISGPFPRAHSSVQTRQPVLGRARFNKLFQTSVLHESVERFSTLLHLRPFGQSVASTRTAKCKDNSCPVESEVITAVVDVSQEHVASVFRVRNEADQETSVKAGGYPRRQNSVYLLPISVFIVFRKC